MRLFCLALLIPLTACASSPDTKFSGLEPIVSLETIDLAYRGDISSAGLPEPPPVIYDKDAADKGQVAVRARIYEVENEALQKLMGPRGIWMRAERVLHGAARGTLVDLCESGDAELLHNGSISITRGNASSLSVCNSISYVDSFELKPIGSETIADPIVKAARDGMQLEVHPALTDEDGMCTVNVGISVSTLQRPIPATTGTVPGTDVDIFIQTPMFATQELNFDVTLGTGEGLLIGPLAPMEGARPLMILLSAKSVAEVEKEAQE